MIHRVLLTDASIPVKTVACEAFVEVTPHIRFLVSQYVFPSFFRLFLAIVVFSVIAPFRTGATWFYRLCLAWLRNRKLLVVGVLPLYFSLALQSESVNWLCHSSAVLSVGFFLSPELRLFALTTIVFMFDLFTIC